METAACPVIEPQVFASIVAHDLKGPLNTISLYVQLLSKKFGESIDADSRELMRFVVHGTQQMRALIDSLMELGGLPPVTDDNDFIDVNGVLEDVLIVVGRKVSSLQATITHDELPRLWGHRGPLTQVFQNLILNALKYRSVRPPAIHVAAMAHPLHWEFRVTDNGIGFAPERAEEMFLPFRRLDPRDGLPGKGLGLFICRLMLERMGGRISATSTPGIGSTFTFTVPRSPL